MSAKDHPEHHPHADMEYRNHRVLERLEVPLFGLFILGVLYTLYAAHGVILPLAIALLTSLLLAPLVKHCQRDLKIPRAVSALVLLLLLVALLGGLGWIVSKPLAEWAAKAPKELSEMLMGQSVVRTTIEEVSRSAEEVKETVDNLSTESVKTVVVEDDSWRETAFAKVSTGLGNLALAMALSYFLLVNGDRLIQNLIGQMPRWKRRVVLRVVKDSQEEVAKYLGIIGLSNTMVGALTALLAWGVGLPTPMLWGVVAGLTRFVPYLGVIVTIALLAVVSAATFDELWMIAIAPLGYLALTSLVGFFLEPYVHGFRMAINPAVIFCAIFFWGWLWGPVGVLLAVPLMTLIQVVLKQIPILHPIYRVIAR